MTPVKLFPGDNHKILLSFSQWLPAFGLSLNFSLILSALSFRLCKSVIPSLLQCHCSYSKQDLRICAFLVLHLLSMSQVRLFQMNVESVLHSSGFQERIYQLLEKTKSPFFSPPPFTPFRIQLKKKKRNISMKIYFNKINIIEHFMLKEQWGHPFSFVRSSLLGD